MTQIIEALLFSSDAPLSADELARADESLNEDLVDEAIKELTQIYEESERAFEIKQLGGGYQILTRPVYAPYLERFDTVPKSSRLSTPALETLAIIAYRQPIGRIDIEYIRGVSSAGVIRTLQERELVDVVGRSDGLGRPLLYGTTGKFLEHFGFAELDELPRTEDLPVVLKGDNVSEYDGTSVGEEHSGRDDMGTEDLERVEVNDDESSPEMHSDSIK